MRRKYILCFLALAICMEGLPQFKTIKLPFPLTVTYIHGTILIVNRDNLLLQVGAQLKAGDELRQADGNSFFCAINADKGSFLIGKKSEREKTSSEWQNQAGIIFRQHHENETLYYRSGDVPLLNDELHTIDSINGLLLVEKLNKYLFSLNKYPIDSDHFFYLQFQYAGGYQNAKLDVNNDTLNIRLDQFTQLEDSAHVLKGKFSLGYFSGSSGKGYLIAVISPYFDKKDEALELVAAVVKSLRSQGDPSRIFRTCYDQLYTFLGKPGYLFLKNAIDAETASAR